MIGALLEAKVAPPKEGTVESLYLDPGCVGKAAEVSARGGTLFRNIRFVQA
jgi:hypothetical protein